MGARASARQGLAGFLFAILAAGLLTALDNLNLLPEAPDAWTYDLRTALLSPRAAEPRKDIAVVLIGEESLADYPTVVPVDRGLLAALVRVASKAGAKAIGLDFLFERETSPEKTEALRRAIAASDVPVVVGTVDARIEQFSESQRTYHERFVAKLSKGGNPITGHVVVARDPQKLAGGSEAVRYIAEPAAAGQGQPLPGFAEVLAAAASGEGRMPTVPSSRLIAWQLPPARGGGDLFPTLEVPRHRPGSSDDVIFPPGWRSVLSGRIVLIGTNLGGIDKHLTPLSVLDGVKVPGIMVQAQILAQLLDGRSINLLPFWVEAGCLAVIAAVGFWLGKRWRVHGQGILAGTLGVALLAGAGACAFWAFALVIPSASFFFAWVLGLWGGQSGLWSLAMKRVGVL